MKQCYMLVKQFLVVIAFLIFVTKVPGQTYVVTSVADDGSPGTLRDAITSINNGTNTTVNFDFSALGTAPYTITLTSSLPTIQPGGTTAIVIDGYSEPSSTPGTIGSRVISVQINGNNVAANAFTIGQNNVAISGLAVYRCQQIGFSILPGFSNSFIWGNFIGTDYTGLTPLIGNGNAGVFGGMFESGTANTRIIVGTDGNGINDSWEGNLVVNNGSGGPTDGGIVVANTQQSRFSGNIIGLGKDGVTKTNLYNNGSGLALIDRSTSDTIGTNGDGNSDALERNFVSNNARGIYINAKSNGNVVANNVVGLDISGANAGNITGVIIDNVSGTIIGTNADGISDGLEKNYISASLGEAGIIVRSGNLGGIFDQNADGNKIAGNSIGVSLDDITAAGNAGGGILLQALDVNTVSNNIIGSDGNGINESVKGNIIANHTFTDGIRLDDPSNTNLVTGNRISRNSVYANGYAGINLANPAAISGTGITPNQLAGFSTTGPNNLLNFPVITSITSDFQNITFSGFARPGAVLEFYIADKTQLIPTPPAGLTKNFGQGRTFLFQAKQGGTLNGITDVGTNSPGSYTIADAGTASGPSPITVDYNFQFVVNAASIGITSGAPLSFTILAIDDAATTGNSNNTSTFSANFDANLVALPITLIDFVGNEKEGKVYLNWSTSSELNNVFFEIEKSSTGSNFVTIGNVKANSGMGINTYSFIDNRVSGNINFYRLKQIDVDGKYTYSKVIALKTDLSANSIKLFPSSFNDHLNISINSKTNEKLAINILDLSGRIVKSYSMQLNKGVDSFNINNLNDLIPGVYILNVKGKTISYQQKVLKN